jgi:hypothetical protein
VATDIVIGGLGLPSYFPGIEARQGIILGKSGGRYRNNPMTKPGFRHIAAILRAVKHSIAVSRLFEALFSMKRLLSLAWLAAIAVLPFPQIAQAQRSQYNALVATHAKANGVPEVLVHRVIVRESKYQPDLVGRGGTIGLMQIKLATARSLGYAGDADGLRDPDTNLTYAVKYLAGAYRAANGDHDRAVHYYAAGYYMVAKQQRLERQRVKPAGPVLASAPPKDTEQAAKPEEIGQPEQTAKPEQAAKPEEAAKPEQSAKPKAAAATPKEITLPKTATVKPKKEPRKKLAEAREQVPRPPANIPTGANTAKPR